MARLTREGNAARGAALLAGLGIMLLAGCDEGGNFSLRQPPESGQSAASDGARATRLAGRDVEAPEVFQVTDMGLWDGRPSLGGVWVAHPDVREPERVIIRNTADGTVVIGALFRRQRDMPGPVFQVSSDAAAALGLLAGSPQQLSVTALRREEAPAGATDGSDAGTSADIDPDSDVTARDPDPVAGAGAAIETDVEAQGAAQDTRVRRVPAGPAGISAERAELVGKRTKAGVADAYPVTI